MRRGGMYIAVTLKSRPSRSERLLLDSAFGTLFGGNGSFSWRSNGTLLVVERKVSVEAVAEKLQPGWGAGLYSYVRAESARESGSSVMWERIAAALGVNEQTGVGIEALVDTVEVG